MANFSAFALTNEIEDIESVSEEEHYDAQHNLTGTYRQTTRLHNEEGDYSYRIESFWTGDTVTENSDAGFDVTHSIIELKADPDNEDSYIKTTSYYGETEDQVHVVSEDDILEGNAKEDIVYRISGSDQSNYGGFYYGDWLRAQTRLYSEFMSVDTENNQLVYDPPKIGVDENLVSYYDLYYRTDDKGLILLRTADAYDEPTDSYASTRMEASYTFYPEEE